MSSNDDVKRYSALMDALADHAEGMTDEQVLADVRDAGRDVAADAEAMRQSLLSAVTRAKSARLIRAAEAHTLALERLKVPVVAIPNDPVRRRRLLDRSLARRPEVQQMMTVAYRDGKSLPEDDVESLLKQLASLGALATDDE